MTNKQMDITRLQLNKGSCLSGSIIDGCFTTTCGGLLRLRLDWKMILVVVDHKPFIGTTVLY